MRNKRKGSIPIETNRHLEVAIERSLEVADERRSNEERIDPNPLADQFVSACQNGDVRTVEELLQKGANPNTGRCFGSPLCAATRSKNPIEVINLLIKAGADPNREEEPGWTPLFCAVGNNRVDAARLLIESGADVNGQCSVNGWTALMNAACFGLVTCAVELLAMGADVTIRSGDNLTAADIATANGHRQILHVLSKY